MVARRTGWRLLPALAAVVLAAAGAAGCFSLPRDPHEPAVGTPAPALEARPLSTAGKPVDIADLAPRNRFPVLVFYRGHW